jgi:hypothetical protein
VRYWLLLSLFILVILLVILFIVYVRELLIFLTPAYFQR